MKDNGGSLFDPEDDVFFDLTPGSIQELLITGKYQLCSDMAELDGRITDVEDEFWFLKDSTK